MIDEKELPEEEEKEEPVEKPVEAAPVEEEDEE